VKSLGRRSVYQDRLPPARPKIIFTPTHGLVRIEVGKFHPTGPCCEDPLYCERLSRPVENWTAWAG
jgi:hypothetical protein